MNTLSAINRSNWLTRIRMFLFLTLPGAFLVGTCASLIFGMNLPGIILNGLVAALLALGVTLLLLGTRTMDEPLFLLVFLPMPIFITLGFHLGYLGKDLGFPIAILGMIWPMITYPSISRYYKRRATKAAFSAENFSYQVGKEHVETEPGEISE